MKILIAFILAIVLCHLVTASTINNSVTASLHTIGPYNVSFNISTLNNYDIIETGPEINKFVNPDIGQYIITLINIHDENKKNIYNYK